MYYGCASHQIFVSLSYDICRPVRVCKPKPLVSAKEDRYAKK